MATSEILSWHLATLILPQFENCHVSQKASLGPILFLKLKFSLISLNMDLIHISIIEELYYGYVVANNFILKLIFMKSIMKPIKVGPFCGLAIVWSCDRAKPL